MAPARRLGKPLSETGLPNTNGLMKARVFRDLHGEVKIHPDQMRNSVGGRLFFGVYRSQQTQDRARYGSQGSIPFNNLYEERKEPMIVNRRTFNVKVGCMEEAVALVLGEIAADSERGGYTGRIRVYTSSIGTFDQMAVEWEYQDLAEYEEMWAEWAALPTTAAFMQKWIELVKEGGTNEIWDLAE